MSTPPTLTVTNQQAAQPPINTPAFRTFFSRLTTSIHDGLSQRPPWAGARRSELHGATRIPRRRSVPDQEEPHLLQGELHHRLRIPRPRLLPLLAPSLLH
ncbi:hypothetical protein Bca4012_057754 [Brassica carinata]|uniref:Uncharacterized protein n=1 Tax=Brassica carinata TaxID=52824 RepID=A0A8X8B2U7_BRACI|nr:hypothetical protein Bca52824_015047 [Brassica carinata]